MEQFLEANFIDYVAPLDGLSLFFNRFLNLLVYYIICKETNYLLNYSSSRISSMNLFVLNLLYVQEVVTLQTKY